MNTELLFDYTNTDLTVDKIYEDDDANFIDMMRYYGYLTQHVFDRKSINKELIRKFENSSLRITIRIIKDIKKIVDTLHKELSTIKCYDYSLEKSPLDKLNVDLGKAFNSKMYDASLIDNFNALFKSPFKDIFLNSITAMTPTSESNRRLIRVVTELREKYYLKNYSHHENIDTLNDIYSSVKSLK